MRPRVGDSEIPGVTVSHVLLPLPPPPPCALRRTRLTEVTDYASAGGAASSITGVKNYKSKFSAPAEDRDTSGHVAGDLSAAKAAPLQQPAPSYRKLAAEGVDSCVDCGFLRGL